jgi:transketolase
MRQEMPERWFMEGITEANVIGMAAGFALEGYVPYVNTIATFITRRRYEQVAVDLCLHDLPVRLIANGGGSFTRRSGRGISRSRTSPSCGRCPT